MKKLILINIMLMLLSGCSGLIRALYDQPLFVKFPMEVPLKDSSDEIVINNNKIKYVDIGVAGIGTTGAKRRLLISFVNYNDPKETKVRVCAEPLPDVAENIASEATIKLIGKLESATKDDIKSIILSERHPATEFYKAGLFSICQMAMSGYIEEVDVKELVRELGDNAKEIFMSTEFISTERE